MNVVVNVLLESLLLCAHCRWGLYVFEGDDELLAPKELRYINDRKASDHGFHMSQNPWPNIFSLLERPSGLGLVRCPEAEDETSQTAVGDRIPCTTYTIKSALECRYVYSAAFMRSRW